MDEPIRLGEAVGGVEVRLCAVLPPDDLDDPYYTGFYVVETGGNVSASVTATFAGAGLGAFLSTLAEDFRGWAGERTWDSLYHELAVSATHESLGRVRLRWTLAEGAFDGWELTATTLADAGEDMRRMATVVRDLEACLKNRP